MYHGAHTAFAKHIGLCLTDDAEAARRYASKGMMAVLAINLDGLTVIEVDGYDREDNAAAGDRGENLGADVLVFEDEDEAGQAHRTWRLMSAAAVERLQVAGVVDAAWWDAAVECWDVAEDDRLSWIATWSAVTDDPDEAVSAHEDDQTPDTFEED